MNTTDIGILIAVVIIVGGALWYIIKKKRSGARCIGCPDGDKCNGHCNCKK
ncbi:MAG: LPXTG cell wall anchor domain-containing protein [Clostridia bacterium]|nr:LPXTG cell wall anchor domain-containing protein [Clostridia bacterium]